MGVLWVFSMPPIRVCDSSGWSPDAAVTTMASFALPRLSQKRRSQERPTPYHLILRLNLESPRAKVVHGCKGWGWVRQNIPRTPGKISDP